MHVIPSTSIVEHSPEIFGFVTPAFSKEVTIEAEKWFAVIKKKTRRFGIPLKTKIISTGESPVMAIVEKKFVI